MYLQKAKDLADKALANPDCAGLFGSKDGMTATQVLEGTAQGVSWNIDFIYSTSQDAAVATTRPTISLGNLFGPTSFVTKIDEAFNLARWITQCSSSSSNSTRVTNSCRYIERRP